MKCVKKGDEIRKVSDNDAAQLVKDAGWSYCKREEWRKKVRDAGKKADATVPVPANVAVGEENTGKESKQARWKKSDKKTSDKTSEDKKESKH